MLDVYLCASARIGPAMYRFYQVTLGPARKDRYYLGYGSRPLIILQLLILLCIPPFDSLHGNKEQRKYTSQLFSHLFAWSTRSQHYGNLVGK